MSGTNPERHARDGRCNVVESVGNAAVGGVGLPRFNREIKQQLKSTLPLAFARPEDPLLGATLLGILVRDGEAKVDDAILHGRSDIERGIRFSAQQDELQPDERWGVVYVAMKNGPEGLFYKGVTALHLLIDRAGRRGHRDIALSVNRMSDAVAGRVDLSDLAAGDRAAVSKLLEERGKDVWQRTPEAVRRSIQGD